MCYFINADNNKLLFMVLLYTLLFDNFIVQFLKSAMKLTTAVDVIFFLFAYKFILDFKF